MKKLGKLAVLGVAVAAIAGGATIAHAQVKPEDTLKVRQGFMQAIRLNFGSIAAAAKDDKITPAHAQNADNIVAITKMATLGWTPGSETVSKASKPEAFTSPNFKAGFERLGDAAGKLSAAIKANDKSAITAQVAAVGGACKACHDNFRN
jgi:cytochrome c556